MLVFIIPLKNPDLSKDWLETQRLCENTLTSLCNQTDKRFKVVLICREFDRDFSHPNLEILRHPFPNPKENWEDMHEDKYDKIYYGLSHVESLAPCHIMKFDADDFASNKLAAHVAAHPENTSGWYAQTGYVYTKGKKLIQKRRKFYYICGSSTILYSASLKKPFSHGMAQGHQHTIPYYQEQGTPLLPLPFPAVMYNRNHGGNISTTHNPYGFNAWNWKGKTSRAIKTFFRIRLMTNGIKKEFGMNSLA